MRAKQLIGFIFLSLGVTFILCAAHGMGYLSSRHSNTELLTNSPVSPTERYPQNAPISGKSCQGPFGFVIGSILALSGVALSIYYRQK